MRRRRSYKRRARKSDSEAVFSFMFIAVIGSIIYSFFTAVFEFIKTPAGIGSLTAVVAIAIVWFILKNRAEEKERERLAVIRADWDEKLGKVEIDDQRNAYFIDDNDYRRGNAKENAYRKGMHFKLLEVYENRCAKCFANDNGVDLDHFFLSKNEGGSFAMRHRDGQLVNNAIPLCQSCNRRKSDGNYREFFTQQELLRCLEKNALLTIHLNGLRMIDSEGQVVKRSRKAKAI